MNMIKRIAIPVTILAATFISMAGAHTAFAGGLYDAPPSATSAFVRFIEAEEYQIGSNGREWRDQEVPFSDFGEGEYIAVESALIDSEPGNFITVAFQPTGEILEFNEVPREKGKVALQLLNLSASPVALKTVNGKVTILESVGAGDLQARQINPFAFRARIEAQGAELGTVDLALKRSDNPVIIVRSDGSIELIKSTLKGSSNQ